MAEIVAQFVEEGSRPTKEQMGLIIAELKKHKATAEWLDALTAYVDILNTEIGWTKDKSVQFVMDKYGHELDNGTAMFVQMYLQSLGG